MLKSFVDVPFFKLTSFRPWLVGSDNPINNLEVKKLLSEKDILNIARYKDLQDFGNAIFDILVQKTSEEDKFEAL